MGAPGLCPRHPKTVIDKHVLSVKMDTSRSDRAWHFWCFGRLNRCWYTRWDRRRRGLQHQVVAPFSVGYPEPPLECRTKHFALSREVKNCFSAHVYVVVLFRTFLLRRQELPHRNEGEEGYFSPHRRIAISHAILPNIHMLQRFMVNLTHLFSVGRHLKDIYRGSNF